MTGRSFSFLVRNLRWGTLALLVCWTSLANAQLDGFQDLTGLKPGRVTEKAQFTSTLSPLGAKPGEEVTLSINVKLPKGYYIYSTTGQFDGRTQIETKATGLEPIDAEFIADRDPKTVFEPEFKVEVSKFHDHVTWTKRYRVAKSADPGTISVSGELNGQYCSEGTDDNPGNCIPIIPSYEFTVVPTAAADAKPANLAPPAPFEHEERPGRPAEPGRPKTNPALLKIKLFPQDAKPGDKVTFSITMQLDEGWHTFSMTQGEGGKPTEVDLDALQGLKPLGDGFQPDRAPDIENDGEYRMETYHDQVTWTRQFEVLADTGVGKYGVRGLLSYQTCEKSCISKRVPFRLGDVSAAEVETPPSRGVIDVVPPKGPQPPVDKPDDTPAAPVGKKPQDQGLIGFLLTAIGFGFVSLLTPCVFPMVPITVSFFLKQSESEHHRPITVAFVFCGSIVATFTILGVGIAAIFGAAQLNALANNPWLNLAIGTVFVVFAFNMLGMFEIRIPSGLLTFTANKEQAGGYLGAMFMALTFTLTSFTCTFAFAGTLLVAAAQGQFYWPIIGMLAFGAAFASPFFVLAMVPSLLKQLPKSGGWMNVVKVVMGLIEIGAAVKFYSVADLAWNPEPVLFDFVFVMISWLVLSLAIALYLLGVFRLAHDVPPTGISVGRLILVMAFLGLSCNLAVGLITHERGGGWIMDQIIAFAPPRFENEAAAEKGGGPPDGLPEPMLAHHGVWFTLDVDKGITLATALNRPMLFDFTGVNCVNCRLMEKKLGQPQNKSRLEKLVPVQLYADKVPTIADPVEAKRLLKRNNGLQTQWFGDVTLPSYAVVTPDGKTILSSYFGLEQKEGEFAAFLDEGMKKWKESQQ
ncbi:MAG: hypothetical protein JSS49_21555 [Planctomycetes bacterium]|nr:hypothetical protein [Planctomycetota bacterium]